MLIFSMATIFLIWVIFKTNLVNLRIFNLCIRLFYPMLLISIIYLATNQTYVLFLHPCTIKIIKPPNHQIIQTIKPPPSHHYITASSTASSTSTETNLETPASCMVTPINCFAISMAILFWVIKINCTLADISSTNFE